MSGSNNNHSDNSRRNSAQELDTLQIEIEGLKEQLHKYNRGESLNEADLNRLNGYAKQEKFNRIEHHYNKKGILHYWYVKVPLKVLNVGSIKDSNQLLTDSYRSLTSRICPLCGQGMLMFNRNAEPVDGNVMWFCSKEPVCNYEVFGPPSGIMELNPDINSIVDVDALRIGKGRWEALTKEEKEELISSHLEKAKIYRAFTMFMGAMLCLQMVLFMFKSAAIFLWTFIFLLALTSYLALISVSWAYRAWQIKTGNVYLPESPFPLWLRTAEKYFSVDWVDEQNKEN